MVKPNFTRVGHGTTEGRVRQYNITIEVASNSFARNPYRDYYRCLTIMINVFSYQIELPFIFEASYVTTAGNAQSDMENRHHIIQAGPRFYV
jgi:hypothetical protein